jgi:hypothetical protein
MKKRALAALWLCAAALLFGCDANKPSVTPSPVPTPMSALVQFESYVTQTGFSFPKHWEYQQDDGIDEGMTALFAFDGGRVGVQFLWMDDAQAQRNVFLQQLSTDNVTTQPYAAGAYEGTVLFGDERGTYMVAFEGSRAWYGRPERLYMRIVFQADGEEVFALERPNMMALLESVEVSVDQTPPGVESGMIERYDYTEDFGLALSAPNSWWMIPDYDMENGFVALSFEAASGGNAYRVELGTLGRAAFEGIVESLKELEHDEDVFDYAYRLSGGVHHVMCVREGKITRVRLESQQVDGSIRYLWTSSALRPVLDEAYYQSVIAPCIDGVVWKK